MNQFEQTNRLATITLAEKSLPLTINSFVLDKTLTAFEGNKCLFFYIDENVEPVRKIKILFPFIGNNITVSLLENEIVIKTININNIFLIKNILN